MIYLILGVILILAAIAIVIAEGDEYSIPAFVFGIILLLFGISYSIDKTGYYLKSYQEQGNLYIAVVQYGKNEEIEVLLTKEQMRFYQENPIGKMSQEDFAKSYELKIKKTYYYTKEIEYETD